MERKEGYYWVRLDDHISPQWQVALWCDNDGGYEGGDWWWRLPGDDDMYFDEDFSEINESRIPSPDEFKTFMHLRGSNGGYTTIVFDAE